MVLVSVACLASSAIKAANATTAAIAKEFTEHAKEARLAMDRQDEYTAGVVTKFHDQAWKMTQQEGLREFVRARGLMPFLQERDSMVKMDIQAVMQNLGCTQREAVDYIRSRFERDTPPES